MPNAGSLVLDSVQFLSHRASETKTHPSDSSDMNDDIWRPGPSSFSRTGIRWPATAIVFKQSRLNVQKPNCSSSSSAIRQTKNALTKNCTAGKTEGGQKQGMFCFGLRATQSISPRKSVHPLLSWTFRRCWSVLRCKQADQLKGSGPWLNFLCSSVCSKTENQIFVLFSF